MYNHWHIQPNSNASDFNKQDKIKQLVKTYTRKPGGTKGQPGYQPAMYSVDTTVTPYLHALLCHVPAHLRTCRTLGVPLKCFSTEAVEKKNHQHTRFFFAHTTKNGGKQLQSAIEAILRKENRLLFPITEKKAKKTRKLVVK
jgi:hypothetical protein